MTYAEKLRADEKALAAAIATFPETFGLRAFPGRRFRLSKMDSFVSENRVVLYTEILGVGDRHGEWLCFAKGSPEELRREVTP